MPSSSSTAQMTSTTTRESISGSHDRGATGVAVVARLGRNTAWAPAWSASASLMQASTSAAGKTAPSDSNVAVAMSPPSEYHTPSEYQTHNIPYVRISDNRLQSFPFCRMVSQVLLIY